MCTKQNSICCCSWCVWLWMHSFGGMVFTRDHLWGMMIWLAPTDAIWTLRTQAKLSAPMHNIRHRVCTNVFKCRGKGLFCLQIELSSYTAQHLYNIGQTDVIKAVCCPWALPLLSQRYRFPLTQRDPGEDPRTSTRCVLDCWEYTCNVSPKGKFLPASKTYAHSKARKLKGQAFQSAPTFPEVDLDWVIGACCQRLRAWCHGVVNMLPRVVNQKRTTHVHHCTTWRQWFFRVQD